MKVEGKVYTAPN